MRGIHAVRWCWRLNLAPQSLSTQVFAYAVSPAHQQDLCTCPLWALSVGMPVSVSLLWWPQLFALPCAGTWRSSRVDGHVLCSWSFYWTSHHPVAFLRQYRLGTLDPLLYCKHSSADSCSLSVFPLLLYLVLSMGRPFSAFLDTVSCPCASTSWWSAVWTGRFFFSWGIAKNVTFDGLQHQSPRDLFLHFYLKEGL